MNIDENLGDVVLRHWGDFIVRWSNMIKHITVLKKEECNTDVMSCAYHLSVDLKIPLPSLMLLCDIVMLEVVSSWFIIIVYLLTESGEL